VAVAKRCFFRKALAFTLINALPLEMCQSICKAEWNLIKDVKKTQLFERSEF